MCILNLPIEISNRNLLFLEKVLILVVAIESQTGKTINLQRNTSRKIANVLTTRYFLIRPTNRYICISCICVVYVNLLRSTRDIHSVA